MNLWKLEFKDEDKELEIHLLVKAKSLDTALSLSNHIADKRTIKLKAIKQIWVDKGRGNVEEKRINVY